MTTPRRNRASVADLDELTPEKIASLPIGDLCMLQDELIAEAETIKRRTARLLAGLGIRYSAKDKALRGDKPTGILHFDDAGYGVQSDATKTVKWDQAKLEAALNALPDGWTHYAKYKLEVEERKFTAAPPAVQTVLTPARTVIVSPSKFKIVRKESGK